MRDLVLSLLMLTFVAGTARGLVINGGTGTENFTAPPGTGNPGFANVGDNGIYLGNYSGQFWVLTVTHIGAGSIVLNGNTYPAVSGSSIIVRNQDNSTTDLTLFRIASDPGLPNLTLLSGANPALNSTIRMVGDGRTEGASTFTQWGITTNPGANDDVWTAGAGTDKSGYTTVAGAGMRWGDSRMSGTASYDIGTGVTSSFYMNYTSAAGRTMAQVGDSGGAAFYFNSGNSTWYLAGVLGAIGTFGSGQSPDNQPANTAVFGNVTLAASIPSYHSFITTAIPEPSTYAALAGALALLGTAWFRRRRTVAR